VDTRRRRQQARDPGLDEDERAVPLSAPRTCPPGRGGPPSISSRGRLAHRRSGCVA
jgi:hypothetical protein